MAKEILLTAVEAVPATVLRPLLDEFEQLHRISVRLQIVPWAHYRSEFVEIALHRQNGDVGLVGAPLTGDLIGMNALRPFSALDIAGLGGASEFLPPRWRSGVRPGGNQVWAVPWALDVRALYYWRDLLAEAGVNEASAFASAEGLSGACRQLRDWGMDHPLGLSSERYSILHSVASFIWAAGGDLFNPAGGQVIFHEAVGLEGMRAYFDLLQFVPPNLDIWNDRTAFTERQVAIIVGNGWAENQRVPEQLGCAPMPGASYVGGPDIIVWDHTRSDMAAVELVCFLSQSKVQRRVSQLTPLLPVRVSDLTMLSGSESVVHRGLGRAALGGRSFPCVPVIGLLEDRLSLTLCKISQEIQSNPTISIDSLLQSRIVPLGKRTNSSLALR